MEIKEDEWKSDLNKMASHKREAILRKTSLKAYPLPSTTIKA